MLCVQDEIGEFYWLRNGVDTGSRALFSVGRPAGNVEKAIRANLGARCKALVMKSFAESVGYENRIQFHGSIVVMKGPTGSLAYAGFLGSTRILPGANGIRKSIFFI